MRKYYEIITGAIVYLSLIFYQIIKIGIFAAGFSVILNLIVSK
jgi:hypothetical protein